MSEKKKLHGFSALTAERRSEIAAKGGASAHAQGLAHKFTPEEARIAGRLGGLKVSANRAHMAEIGKKGAIAKNAKFDRSPTQ